MKTKPENQTLRVAIALSALRPGGMERVVLHLAKGLVERNVKVLIVCLQDPGALSAEIDDERIEIVSLNSFRSMDFVAVWRLRKVLVNFNPSLISVHDYSSLPYVVAANALRGRSPIMFTAHGLLYEGFESRRNRNSFFSKFLSAFSAVSKEVAERHRSYLKWTKPIEVIPNGVPPAGDQTDREKTRTDLGCGPDDFLFLAVGNPRPEKGFEDLIDALVLRPDSSGIRNNFKVVVAGELNGNDYCRSLLKHLEGAQILDLCRFIGFQSNTAELYAAADAFVLPSRSEGLPMVILEAMMQGLPVVATRVGGIPNAVGEHVLLVDPDRPSQLIQAMQRLFDDEGLTERLSSEGRDHVVKNFGVERMVDDYLCWYAKFNN